MTVIDLLDALTELCTEVTADMRLPVRQDNSGAEAVQRAPLVFKMDLPKKAVLSRTCRWLTQTSSERRPVLFLRAGNK